MLKHYSDEDIFLLVKEVKKGDVSAFGELCDIYGKFVSGTVLSEIKDRKDADELTEEIFVKAYQEISSFSKDKSFGFWLHGIITERIKNYKKKKELSDPEAVQDGESEVPKKRSALYVESPSGVVKLINMLDDDIREPVIYRDIMGLTYLEIADLTGVAVGSAKARVTQGREKVKAALERYISGRAAKNNGSAE